MSRRVFVSHSREDEAAARGLKRSLEGRGDDVRLSVDALRPGEDWADQMRRNLAEADAIVLLIGQRPGSWERHQWSQALQTAWRPSGSESVPVLPVVLSDGEPPSFLRNQHYVRVSGSTADWTGVLDALRANQGFSWEPSADDRAHLASRLDDLQQLAASLPDETAA